MCFISTDDLERSMDGGCKSVYKKQKRLAYCINLDPRGFWNTITIRHEKNIKDISNEIFFCDLLTFPCVKEIRKEVVPGYLVKQMFVS